MTNKVVIKKAIFFILLRFFEGFCSLFLKVAVLLEPINKYHNLVILLYYRQTQQRQVVVGVCTCAVFFHGVHEHSDHLLGRE